MFWGSFTAKGLGRLIIIEGMMNSDKYKAILQSHLLTVLEKDLFVCLWLPLLFLGMEIRHAVNLIEIRPGERWQPISNQS